MSRPVMQKAHGVKQSEISIHIPVARFLRLAWPGDLPFTHFPAGERRDPRVGAKLKAMGLAPGWPDFIFNLPNGQAAYIELKTSGGALSDDQIGFRAKVVAIGCAYAVCRSVDEVEAVITRWLAAFGRAPLARLAQRVAA